MWNPIKSWISVTVTNFLVKTAIHLPALSNLLTDLIICPNAFGLPGFPAKPGIYRFLYSSAMSLFWSWTCKRAYRLLFGIEILKPVHYGLKISDWRVACPGMDYMDQIPGSRLGIHYYLRQKARRIRAICLHNVPGVYNSERVQVVESQIL